MKNLGASVRARLTNHARTTSQPLSVLMERFVLGRLLWRLSRCEGANQFVLKGAQLFSLWAPEIHRPTRDLDLLSFGESSPQKMELFFRALLSRPAEPEDGLVWGGVAVERIREDQRYEGVRITVRATLDGAVIPAQVDVGFGDVITPEPVEMTWQELLGFPEARLLAYPPETVIAEKLQAAHELEMANSRMKDFFDLDWLSRHMEFDLKTLSLAVRATFSRRETPMPIKMPLALTEAFSSDSGKVTQWNAFLRKNKIDAHELSVVIKRLHAFLSPVLFSESDSEQMVWKASAGWSKPAE